MPHTCKRRPGGGGAAVDSLACDEPHLTKKPYRAQSSSPITAQRLAELIAIAEARIARKALGARP
jgi:hypothetical protein